MRGLEVCERIFEKVKNFVAKIFWHSNEYKKVKNFFFVNDSLKLAN